MIICVCYNVTESQIRVCITRGCDDVSDVVMETGATTGCGLCRRQIIDTIANHITKNKNDQTSN